MLPVTEIYPELIHSLQANSMVLLQAPPGAGKSTWLPLQLIRDNHFKHVVMLEPRRLAARNIANYLARLQNESLGESIGLHIRHEKYISKHTKLEIVTEGMLTRMLQNDPELTDVDCIIFDEFHERSLAADTALAFAFESQSILRPDLKILLMSATLNAQSITKQFNCPVITSKGRSFPVDEIYHPLKEQSRWLDEIPTLVKKAMKEQPGSCLVFLPGQREIQQVAKNLNGLDEHVRVFSLYGDQTKTMQQNAIAAPAKNERKIVLATNVAETSLTIDGIQIVIDSGKKRAAQFNLNTGVTELRTASISIASAIQRAGRAGRTEAGVVYRLGTKEAFHRREAYDQPDILCSDISSFILECKRWGSDISELTLLDTPSVAQQKQACDVLRMLEAIDKNEKITPLGEQLLEVGTDIRWAYMLLKAKKLNSKYSGIELLSIYLLALLDSRVSKNAELSSELLAQLASPHPIFKKQLAYWLKRFSKKPSTHLELSYLPLLVALAYPDRIAKKRGEGYLLSNGAGVDTRDGYWLNDEFLSIAQLGGKLGTYIFSATALDISLLQESLPHLFQHTRVCEFNEKAGRFIFEDRIMLNAIIVSKRHTNEPIDDQARTDAWISLIHKRGFNLFKCVDCNLENKHSNKFIQLLTRMTLASAHFPEEFPIVNEQELLNSLNAWLSPYLKDIKNLDELTKVDLVEPLKQRFDWHQQTTLKTLLPTHIKVPSGSNIPISYQLDGPAKLSVRMQEVFGLTHTPTLCKGKVELLINLLSPAHRSLQLTQDLAGFWVGSYDAIKKEMKGRYPKHYWPDNPQDAKATFKTKAKM